jgi:hypothetical protein
MSKKVTPRDVDGHICGKIQEHSDIYSPKIDVHAGRSNYYHHANQKTILWPSMIFAHNLGCGRMTPRARQCRIKTPAAGAPCMRSAYP